MSIAWIIGALALVLTPIIFIHELGHFLAARFFKIRVEEFGIGFPPRALKLFEWGGTIFSLNWIPVGGFVRPAGEDDPSVPDGLAGASKTARFTVLAAGSTFNFILAILLFWIAYMVGPPAISVDSVDPNTPASAAGLMAGDVLLAINGIEIEDDRALLIDEVQNNGGQEVSILIDRNGEEMLIALVPRSPGEYIAGEEGPLGITLDNDNAYRYSQGPVDAMQSAVGGVWEIMYLTARIPVMLIQGDITPEEARPVGIIGIGQIAGQAAQTTATTGNWFQLLWIVAFISVAVGFTNLLPIPALDGGRILFVIIEAIRGRRIEPEREGMVHLLGMIFLLGLMVLLIVQDLVNPIIPLN